MRAAVREYLLCQWVNSGKVVAGFSFSPATAVIQWTDKNGTFTGNLATFTTTADKPTVSQVSAITAGLTSISGLSTLPLLLYLTVPNNSISSLNIAGCASLISLSCGANLLTSLDASACPTLQSLDSNSQTFLTSINTSGLASLNSFVSDNSPVLATVNVSSNLAMNNMDLSACALSTAQINSILIALDTNGLSNGAASLQGQSPPAPPSGLGIVAYNSLTVAKNWIIFTD